jgi:hypothetical protein
MADAIPSGNAQPVEPQSTVIVSPAMSQWAAMRQAGWWSGLDTTIVTLLSVLWLTALYWKVFGHPTMLVFIAFLLVTIALQLVWATILIFRCAWFVLRLNADVALMPEASARIAVAYLAGLTPKNK